MAVDDKEAAQTKGDELQGESQSVKPRHVFTAVVRLIHVPTHVVIIVLVEFSGLVFLAYECLDDAVAFDVLLDHRIHRSERVADGEEQRAPMHRKPAGKQKDERRDTGQGESQTPVDGNHHGKRTHEHDHAIGRLKTHPTQCMTDGISVRGHTTHDVAGARVIEIGEVELMQLLVFVAHQTVDGILPEPFHPHLAAVSGAHTHDGKNDHHHAESGQFVRMPLHDHAVDDGPGQQRNDKRHGVVDAEHHYRTDDTGKVRPAIRQYPSQIACIGISLRVYIHGSPSLFPLRKTIRHDPSLHSPTMRDA